MRARARPSNPMSDFGPASPGTASGVQSRPTAGPQRPANGRACLRRARSRAAHPAAEDRSGSYRSASQTRQESAHDARTRTNQHKSFGQANIKAYRTGDVTSEAADEYAPFGSSANRAGCRATPPSGARPVSLQVARVTRRHARRDFPAVLTGAVCCAVRRTQWRRRPWLPRHPPRGAPAGTTRRRN